MLTAFQKQKLPKLFAVHDLNHDGVISREDFVEYTKRIASTRGWQADSPAYQELLARFLTFWAGLEEITTRKGAREVTITEWYEYWDRILNTPGVYDEVAAPIGRMIFTILDQDGDGLVTDAEFVTTFSLSGLDEAEATRAFGRLDADRDGRLSITEIMWHLEQFFRSEDPADPGNELFGAVEDAEVNV